MDSKERSENLKRLPVESDNQLIIQRIMVKLATNSYYVDVLQYYEKDDVGDREGIGIPITTGDFFIDDNEAKQEREQEQDAEAC